MAKEGLIRKYLLGELSPKEREEVEDQYFADADFFEQVVAEENDLIDSYARGKLSESETELFERNSRAFAAQAGRIEFARTLAQVVGSREEALSVNTAARPPWFSRFFQSPKVQLAWTLAIATLAVGVSVLSLQNYRLRRTVEDARAETRREGDALRNQIAALGEKLQLQNGQERGEIAELGAPADLRLRLIPGATRGGTVGEELILPDNDVSVRLEMVLEQDQFKTYEAVLQSAEGIDIKGLPPGKNLRSSSSRGDRVVIWRVPSKSIPVGDYSLQLRGRLRDGTVEEIQSYTFRAIKRNH